MRCYVVRGDFAKSTDSVRVVSGKLLLRSVKGGPNIRILTRRHACVMGATFFKDTMFSTICVRLKCNVRRREQRSCYPNRAKERAKDDMSETPIHTSV